MTLKVKEETVMKADFKGGDDNDEDDYNDLNFHNYHNLDRNLFVSSLRSSLCTLHRYWSTYNGTQIFNSVTTVALN